MNRNHFGFHFTTALLLGAFTLTSLIPVSVQAEVLMGKMQYPADQYQVASTGDLSYSIQSSGENHNLELISGDGSLVKIDGKSFSFDFSRSRFYNQKRLEKFLNREFSGRKVASNSVLDSIRLFLIPEARADMLPWILGGVALAAVIVAVVYRNKAKKLEEEQVGSGHVHRRRHRWNNDNNDWWRPRHIHPVASFDDNDHSDSEH